MQELEKWDPNNPPLTERRYGATKEPVKPGTFAYSGFGCGTIYLPEGRKVWCTTSEASDFCKQANIVMDYRDSLDGYTGTYLGD